MPKYFALCRNAKGDTYPVLLDEVMPKEHPGIQRNVIRSSICEIPEQYRDLPCNEVAELADRGFREPEPLQCPIAMIVEPVEPEQIKLPLNYDMKCLLKLATGALKLCERQLEALCFQYTGEKDVVMSLSSMKSGIIEIIDLIEEEVKNSRL